MSASVCLRGSSLPALVLRHGRARACRDSARDKQNRQGHARCGITRVAAAREDAMVFVLREQLKGCSTGNEQCCDWSFGWLAGYTTRCVVWTVFLRPVLK